MLGHGVTCESNRVWITKTHFGDNTPFKAHKMFIIARNPIDVIPSAGNFANTFFHSGQVNEQFHVDFPEYWDRLVRNRTLMMHKNHTAILNSIALEIPTLFIRYEDLKLNPVPVLTELFCFLLDVPSIEGTIV